ncbi:MAG: hypothetical protein Kow00127_11570 [Bacteroidales bacterium]
MKLSMTIFLTIMISLPLLAGKKPLIEDYNEVVAAAKAEIQKQLTPPEGELLQFARKYGVKGTFEVKITIHEKGKVATVFFVSRSDDADIRSQNLLGERLKEMKFPFKMPKGKDYQFNYKFSF